MPGRDGSGPAVSGSRSGRGWGLCSGADAVKAGNGSGQGLGPGLFCRRGKGRTFNPQRIPRCSVKSCCRPGERSCRKDWQCWISN